MITLAVEDDLAAIRSCAEAAYARYVPAIGRRPAPMDIDFAAKIAGGEVHVVRDGAGALQGFVIFAARPGHMFLESVAVVPGAAGRGIGKSLIRHCEDEARRRGLQAVHLYTNERMTENLSIYPHLGYIEVDRREEDGFSRVYFEKRLG